MPKQAKIVGRYAPSPTGELHFGNLRTAMLAWMHARLQGGGFIVRVEDLDLPRVVSGSADQILRDLEWFGLDWDGPVVFQSQRNDLYQRALDELAAQALTYPCFCSRRDIRLAASAPHGKVGVYPGTCRQPSSLKTPRNQEKTPAVRVKVADHMSNDIGDFVIKRADALFAYQLAVIVDDLDQGVTEVVRGEDLLDSTAKQIYLAGRLRPNLFASRDPKIQYFHAPLMLDIDGQRLSKRDGSISASLWRQNGGSAEKLLGYLAFTAGILDKNAPISWQELFGKIKDEVDFRRLSSLY